MIFCGEQGSDYTIPSDNRELQPGVSVNATSSHYTIPSDNRELQPNVIEKIQNEIIPYQVITGNYNYPHTPLIGQKLYHTK